MLCVVKCFKMNIIILS